MDSMKYKIAILSLAATLSLTLVSCSQGNINKDHLLNEPEDISITESMEDESYTHTLEDSSEDRAPVFMEFVTDESGRISSQKFFNRDFFGMGYVKYHINSIVMGDTYSESGIDEEKYNQRGDNAREYDHYVTVSMTIENVDVPTDDPDKREAIEAFSLLSNFYLVSSDPSHFDNTGVFQAIYYDKGGLANSEENRYFEYTMPPASEKSDAVLSFGISDEVLSQLIESNTTLSLRFLT